MRNRANTQNKYKTSANSEWEEIVQKKAEIS